MAREVLFKLRIDDSDISKITKFEKKFQQLGKEASKAANDAHKTWSGKKWTLPHAAIDRVARQTFRVLTGEINASIKAFSDFEQGMAEIQKTSNATEPELKKLGEQIRNVVVTELKGTSTVSQLQEIAEISAKFGVANQDLANFSTNIAKMSALWDVNVTKTAETTAKILSQYRIQEDEITNIGSAVDGIADSFATNEKFLLEFAQRVSGTARLTNQSLTDVLAVGANIAVETGMRVEAAATAYTKIFQTMTLQVGDLSDEFGGSVEEWTKLINEDGLAAFNLLLKKMQEIRDTKGPDELISSLEDVFGRGVRVQRLLTGMVDAYDKNAEAAERGAKLYQENTRLLDNFAERLKTQKTGIKQVQAQWKDLRIEIGSNLKGAVAETVKQFQESLMPVLQSFQKWMQSPEGQIFFSDVLPAVISGMGKVAVAIGELLGNTAKEFQAIGDAIAVVVDAIQHAGETLDNFIGKYENFSKTVDTKVQGAWGNLTDKILGVGDAEKQAAAAEQELQEKIARKAKESERGMSNLKESVDNVTQSGNNLGKVMYGQSVLPNIQEETLKATTEFDMMTRAIDVTSMTTQRLGNTTQQVFTSMQQTVTTTTQKVQELIHALSSVPGGGGSRQLLNTGASTGSNVFVGTGREWSADAWGSEGPGMTRTVGGFPVWQNLLHGSGAALNPASGLLERSHSGGLITAHNGLRPDEIPVVMQSGEGVLSRRGMQTLDRLNQGQGIGNNITINVNGKIIDKSFMRELRQELQRSQNRVIG